MVGHGSALLRRGLGGADVHAAEHLARVGRDDLSFAESPSERAGEIGLPGRGGAADDDERRQDRGGVRRDAPPPPGGLTMRTGRRGRPSPRRDGR
jgi:hypothetical protein